MLERWTGDAGQEDSAMMHPVVGRTARSGWGSAVARMLVDLVLLNLATVAAVLVRVDFRAAPWPWVYTLRFPGVVENLVFVVASVLLQTPFALWSYSSLRDVERVAIVVAVTKALALLLLIGMSGEVQWSRGAFAASAVLGFLFMAAVRSVRRGWYERNAVQTQKGVLDEQQARARSRVLIVGAGDAGDKVLREFEAHPGLGKVVGLIDDDPAKRGCTMRGVHVRGPVASIADTARRTGATQTVIAIPSHAGAVTRAVLSNLADTDVQVRTLPGMWELVDGSVHVDDLRPILLEDLLSRVPISTDMGPVRAYVEGRHVLVTGAGGSIGSEIVRQVARLNPSQLIMLGRGENRIFRIDRELQEREGTCAVPVIGDMRDEARMTWLFDTYRPDIVFHAAAHKHVPLMEQNPEEAILNNVGGTRTLLRLAASHGAERFVNISTDKAVNPVNFMGASKRVVELVVQVNDGRESLRATSVRFGNVLGSKGSVTEVFQKQLQETRTLRVTDPNMERFFMLIPEAVQLVLQAGALAQGRDIFVLRMGEPIRILDLARSYIKLAGLEVGRDASIVITGNRGNEKMTEELWSSTEHVVPTDYESIMRVECPALADLAVLRQAVGALLNAAHSHDAKAMRAALHAIDPSINIP